MSIYLGTLYVCLVSIWLLIYVAIHVEEFGLDLAAAVLLPSFILAFAGWFLYRELPYMKVEAFTMEHFVSGLMTAGLGCLILASETHNPTNILRFSGAGVTLLGLGLFIGLPCALITEHKWKRSYADALILDKYMLDEAHNQVAPRPCCAGDGLMPVVKVLTKGRTLTVHCSATCFECIEPQQKGTLVIHGKQAIQFFPNNG